MNHYDNGLAEWQPDHQIHSLAQAVGVVIAGRGCLRCQWLAAGMVLRCLDRVEPEVVAKARAIRGRAVPTRHTGRGVGRA